MTVQNAVYLGLASVIALIAAIRIDSRPAWIAAAACSIGTGLILVFMNKGKPK